MTSTVLARKYRPRSFEAMVGQGHVVQALANALTQQRLHHAYLFTGTRGVGKTTVSRILAKSLNCVGPDGQGGITARPCGQCQPCQDIDSGRFVDYVELDAASNRGVEEISALLDQAVYKPVVGRFKVYMIDEVHMLSSHAFNAMLKTLEEPPEYLKFVLATTDPQKVPVTVLSRCLQFNLRPMPMQTVQEHLEQVLAQEGVKFESGALRLLARAARGSMRDGLSLTDQAIAYGGGVLEEPVVRQMLGSVDRQHVMRLLQAVQLGHGAELVAAVDDLRKLGLSAQGTLDELAAALQQIALLQSVPELADADSDALIWQPLAQQLAADEVQLFYSLALHARQELALAPDEYAGLMMVLLRWLAFRPGPATTSGAADPKAEGPVAAGSTGPGPQTPSHVNLGPQTVEAPPAPLAPKPPGDDPRPEPPPWIDEEPADALGGAEAMEMPLDVRTLDAPTMPVATPSLASANRAVESGQGTSAPLQAPVASVRVTEVPRTPLGDRWADVVARMQEQGLIAALVRELAIQAECVAVEDHGEAGQSVWHLRVERESLRSDANRERLAAAVQKVLGGQVRIEMQAGVARDTVSLRDQSARASRQAAAEALIQQDPLVQSLLAQFPGARVLPGSISPLGG